MALEELTNLRCWLDERQWTAVDGSGRQWTAVDGRGLRGIGRVDGSGHVAICDIYLVLCEIEALIR